MSLIDTHCHLHDPILGRDLAGVLDRARAAGVSALVVPGTTVETSAEAIALSEAHEGVYAAVGLHPEAVQGPVDAGALAELAALAAHPRVVAVGEVGLDRSPGRPDLAHQAAWFEAQVRLAAERGLPLLVHSRDATARVLETLRALRPPDGSGPGGVLHAWAGAPEVARELRDLGFCFGVAGVVCRPAARRVRARLAALPLDWLVLETDAPYIGTAKVPRDAVEPAQVAEIRDALAALLGRDPSAVEAATTRTARALLGLGSAD